MTKDWLVVDAETLKVVSMHRTMEFAYSALNEYADEDYFSSEENVSIEDCADRYRVLTIKEREQLLLEKLK